MQNKDTKKLYLLSDGLTGMRVIYRVNSVEDEKAHLLLQRFVRRRNKYVEYAKIEEVEDEQDVCGQTSAPKSAEDLARLSGVAYDISEHYGRI